MISKIMTCDHCKNTSDLSENEYGGIVKSFFSDSQSWITITRSLSRGPGLSAGIYHFCSLDCAASYLQKKLEQETKSHG